MWIYKRRFWIGGEHQNTCKVLQHTNIPYTIIEVRIQGSTCFSNTEFENKISNEFRYSINILRIIRIALKRPYGNSIKVFSMGDVILVVGMEMLEFPEGWKGSFHILMKYGRFLISQHQSIAQEAPIPVYTVTLCDLSGKG